MRTNNLQETWLRWLALIGLASILLQPDDQAVPLSGFVLIALLVLVVYPRLVSGIPLQWYLRRKARRMLENHVNALRDRDLNMRSQRGGAPDRPVLVDTASVIPGRAARFHCNQCNGALRFSDHMPVTSGDVRRRRVDAQCSLCGARRSIWFEIVPPREN